MEIADTVPEKDQPGLCDAIQKELNEWKSGSYHVMVDLINFVKQLVDSGIEIPYAIGDWIGVNLEKHEQSNKKLRELAVSREFISMVGVSLLIAFHHWWKKD